MFSRKLLLTSFLLQISLNTSIDDEKFTKELVAEIEGGISTAEVVAKQVGLDLLGEVIPDSNIFHFRHKRLVKRSVEDVKGTLQRHPSVKSTFHQKKISE
eukprot:TRINITY_DN5239_c0_g1_i1.p1 TRINITY_DN5239_c0_g1~~TRINITY_DN5239_c0_g1_i1.p1  ORF type:complete len:100 (+),score=9.75 TRINITY_DN5239_c0_g1_i1:354-653(+)